MLLLSESDIKKMRAGGFTMQQGLTSEAASMVKQAVNLARRRGHAQVTPLHVAHTMLSSSSGLLRTACLQSHSHPLQCKALELCFNVALNRLPASTSSPMLSPQHSQLLPSISNALVAAFKRAQAHQRRGSIENQQQPLLAVKIEIEQLIISILDDPSVSRVMREASFSSTQVKSNVEQIVSLEICSQNPPNSATSKSKESNRLALSQSNNIPSKVGNPINIRASDDRVRDEDVTSVIDNLMNKKRRRNTVIVGECLATIEGVVRGVIDKFDKGDVPEGLRDVKFIRLPLFSFAHFSREEIEHKLVELRSLARGSVERGVILFLGDLKWTSEYRASSYSCHDEQHERNSTSHCCPVEHMIMELGKLVCGIGENGRFWLMGTATFQTYMRCRTGHPSLETVWDLHPLTIPADSLSLSLNSESSNSQSQFKGKKAGNGSSWFLQLEGEETPEKKLTCCADCSGNFEMEARSLQSRSACNSDSTTTSTLPTWLQQYKDENNRVSSSIDQECVPVRELCKKWNSICSSVHKQQTHSSYEKTLTFSSISPSSSTSGFSYDHHNPNKHKSHSHQGGWPVIEQKQSWNDHHFWISEAVNNKTIEPSLRLYIPEHADRVHPFSSNPNSTPNSASSSDVMEMDQYLPRFKEFNAENLKTLSTALEKKVPWQKNIIPEIASTILQCRSGMVKRKGKWPKNNGAAKEETCLFFQGVDAEGKEKIARELAKLVFGSQSNFISIALSSFSSSTRADSTEDFRNSSKRSRDEQSCSYIERFAEAVSSNPHRVFLVEDIEQADYCSQMGIKRAIERGRVRNSDGDEVSLGDSIVILSCESFSSRSRACSPPSTQKSADEDDQEEKLLGGGGILDQETSPCVSLDLNISIDDDSIDDHSIDDIGLLESVDRRIIFKILEL